MTDLTSVLTPTIIAAVWFGLAIAILDRYDILQPRGDSIGVSGALVVAGAQTVGLAPIAVASMIALGVGHAGRNWRGTRALVGSALVRTGALSAVWLLRPLWADATGASDAFWVVVLPMAYLVAELLLTQVLVAVETRRPLTRLIAGNLQRQAPMLAAETSAAVLATITYRGMGAWTLVLVVALLLMMRQSLALLLEIRETYQMTVQVLVEAAEGQDSRRVGHGERTALIARRVGSRVGLTSNDLERVSYAALLHDIDSLSEKGPSDGGGPGASSEVVEDAAFFADILPILRLCDGRADHTDLVESHLEAAFIVAIASDVDSAMHPALSEVHAPNAVWRLGEQVPPGVKARVAAAAIELGYQTPAMP